MNMDGQNIQRSIHTYLKQLSIIYKMKEQESHSTTILPHSDSKYPYHTLKSPNITSTTNVTIILFRITRRGTLLVFDLRLLFGFITPNLHERSFITPILLESTIPVVSNRCDGPIFGFVIPPAFSGLFCTNLRFRADPSSFLFTSEIIQCILNHFTHVF